MVVVRVRVTVTAWTSVLVSYSGVGLVHMRMDRPFRAAKKAARLMRRQIGDDFASGHEFVANTLEVMRIHHRRHDFLINNKWHVDTGSFRQRGPVLVTQRVADLHTRAHGDLDRKSVQFLEM